MSCLRLRSTLNLQVKNSFHVLINNKPVKFPLKINCLLANDPKTTKYVLTAEAMIIRVRVSYRVDSQHRALPRDLREYISTKEIQM